jgi:hypothetical protein
MLSLAVTSKAASYKPLEHCFNHSTHWAVAVAVHLQKSLNLVYIIYYALYQLVCNSLKMLKY